MSTVNVAPSVGRRHDELDVSMAVRNSTGVRYLRRVCSTVVVLIAVLSTLPAAVNAKPVCGDGMYNVRGQCFPCSTCPTYLIVRRPCMPNSDTLCGSLSDFEFLNFVNDGVSQTDGRHAAGSHRRRNKSGQTAVEASISASPTLSNALVNIHSENSGLLAAYRYGMSD